VAAFEALAPPCKPDEFQLDRPLPLLDVPPGLDIPPRRPGAPPAALHRQTSCGGGDEGGAAHEGPVPSFKLVLALKLGGALKGSVRGKIGPGSTLGRALRRLCAEVNCHWAFLEKGQAKEKEPRQNRRETGEPAEANGDGEALAAPRRKLSSVCKYRGVAQQGGSINRQDICVYLEIYLAQARLLRQIHLRLVAPACAPC
jgi:hypothetical protein